MSTLKVNIIKSLSDADGNPLTFKDSIKHELCNVTNDGNTSISFGDRNHINGGAAANIGGRYSTASAYATTLSSNYGEAKSSFSVAAGNQTVTSASYQFIAGQHTKGDGGNGAAGQAVFGRYNAISSGSSAVFVIGNGTGGGNTNNALEVYRNAITLDINSLPTSDPNVEGQLWRSGTDLKISLG